MSKINYIQLKCKAGDCFPIKGQNRKYYIGTQNKEAFYRDTVERAIEEETQWRMGLQETQQEQALHNGTIGGALI